MSMLGRFGRHRDGAVALEYVLLVAGIGVVVLAAIFLFGEDLSSYWNTLNDSLSVTAT
ncbi:MAG: hypothetical protein RIM84_21155 [Alphaproteobacteria bacterium]